MSAATPDDDSPSWGVVGWVFVLTVFAFGFAAFPLKVIGFEAGYLPGDPADNRLNNYILEHGYRCLTGQSQSFWDAPMFHPTRRITVSSDAHIGMLPFYAALRACCLSPEEAFQGYFLIPFVLNFVAAVWAIRRIGFGPVAAAVGAYVFSFSLPLAAQLQHVQLFPRFLVPPAVVFAWEFLRQPRAWRLGIVAGCVVGEVYLSVYIGYFLGLMLFAGLVTSIRFRHELPWPELLRPGRGEWLRRVAVLAATGLALAPLIAQYSGGTPRFPHATREAAPQPGSWITPPAIAGAFPELADWTELGTWQAGEQQLLPGLLTLIAVFLGVAAVIRPSSLGGRGSVVAVAAASVVVLVCAVTRYGDLWLYQPLTHLPGVGSIRAVGRVVLVLLFPAGIILGAGVETLARAAGRFGAVPWLSVAILGFATVAADQWLTSTTGKNAHQWAPMRYSKEIALARQKRIREAIQKHPAPTLVYVFPSSGAGSQGGPLGVQLEAMRASQDAGIPCVNGWSGYLPAEWDFFPSYRALFAWLDTTGVPPEQLRGLVLIGEPTPDSDPNYEAVMRAAFPPRATLNP